MKKRLFPLTFLTFFVAIAVLFTYSNLSGNNKGFFGNSDGSPLKENNDSSKAVDIQNSFREIYSLYKDRVVFISTEQNVKVNNPFFQDPFFREFFGESHGGNKTHVQKRQGLGTGFIISSDGYICTNHHVVKDVDKVKVKIDGKSYDAKIIGSDQRTDIALLKIETKEPLKPVYFGNSDMVEVGDWAIAIGNPFGLDKTFTVGVVSATGRKDLDMMGGSQSHIQTDASINPGNSGGPLINIRGEVIGINRMIYSKTGGSMGIGFAIPANVAKDVLEQLRIHKKVKRGYIGVQIVPFTAEYAKQLGLNATEGALIGAVQPQSPADKGGVKVGDVIVQIDDKKIKDFSDLISTIDKTKIGSTLKIKVWRNKRNITLFITIKERP